MSKKTLFCALAVILVLFCGSLAMGADKKLGYGFEPGLVAGKDFVAGQLIVGLNEGMSADGVKQAVAAAGIPVVKEIEGAILLQFASEEAAVAAVSALASRPEVAFVERNGFMSIPPQPARVNEKCGTCNRAAQRDLRALSVSTDPGTGYQYHLTVIRKTAALPAPSTTPPTVAVIDTGVDYTHPDLSGRIILGKNCVDNTQDPMDDHGHGTHCAGLIAAKEGNAMYGEGVCPNCKVWAVKALNHEGWGTFFDIADAMVYRSGVRSIFLACLPFLGNKGPNEESPFEDKWDNGSIYPICEHWLRKIDPPFLSPMRIHSTSAGSCQRGGKGVLTK